MSEVKRFRADHRHVVETEFDDAQFVGVADFDRVAAERDAAFETLKASREVGVSDQQTIQSLVSERDALQQRLTAADERADVLEGLLRKVVKRTRWHGDPLKDEVDSALKPAEGRNEPNCLRCLNKKTVPSNLAEGYVMDCPDCCGEEG